MGLIRDEQKPYALYNEVDGGDFDRYPLLHSTG
jgi:hypothetical protein